MCFLHKNINLNGFSWLDERGRVPVECFLRRCLSQLDLVVKRRGQWVHLNGFCPVCVRTCRLRLELHGNSLEQYGQDTLFGAKE